MFLSEPPIYRWFPRPKKKKHVFGHIPHDTLSFTVNIVLPWSRNWLVVWNMNSIFLYMGIIIPTDFHIFQRD